MAFGSLHLKMVKYSVLLSDNRGKRIDESKFLHRIVGARISTSVEKFGIFFIDIRSFFIAKSLYL